MGRIWSDQRRYETWLLVETAAAEAMAAAGIVPPDAARDIRERGAFDIARIDEIEQTTQHDVIAFTTAVAEKVGPSARWLHFGMTSSDVIDTAQALQMREACDVILKDLHALVRRHPRSRDRTPPDSDDRPHARRARRADDLRVEARAVVCRDRPRHRARAARARGDQRRQTLGRGRDLCASATRDRGRRLPAAGSRAGCGRLAGDPARSARRALAALAITGASLEKFALEIRGLQKTEIGEVEEPFAKGQKGSSAMPHKRNPIGCEQVVGLARLLRGNAHAALENVALWHERDISHSSVERIILPDSFIALDHMLRRFTRIVRGMVVNADRMRENLNRSRGVVFSGTVLLELAKKGVSREQAYEWVQRNAMRSFDEHASSRRCCCPIPRSRASLSPSEIERAFDLDDQLKHVDHIFDRVFHPVRA